MRAAAAPVGVRSAAAGGARVYSVGQVYCHCRPGAWCFSQRHRSGPPGSVGRGRRSPKRMPSCALPGVHLVHLSAREYEGDGGTQQV